jgi:hypothetical protein
LLLFALLLANAACKKEEGLIISGTMTDPNQSIKVVGAMVEVWTQRIISGVFEANFRLAGEQVTGVDGKFEIKLESENYTGIKLIISKSGYFGWESLLNLEDFNNNKGHNAEYQLIPKAWLVIHIYNKEPFDFGDYFDIRLLNPYTNCEECCKGNDYEFIGMDINQTIECISAGHQDLIFQWSKRKNKEQVVKTESIFVKALDTTRIELIY